MLAIPSNFIRIICSSDGQSIFDILKIVFSTASHALLFLSVGRRNPFREYNGPQIKCRFGRRIYTPTLPARKEAMARPGPETNHSLIGPISPPERIFNGLVICRHKVIDLRMLYPILVVEYGPKIAHIVRVYLEGAGFKATHAETGRDALASALRRKFS